MTHKDKFWSGKFNPETLELGLNAYAHAPLFIDSAKPLFTLLLFVETHETAYRRGTF